MNTASEDSGKRQVPGEQHGEQSARRSQRAAEKYRRQDGVVTALIKFGVTTNVGIGTMVALSAPDISLVAPAAIYTAGAVTACITAAAWGINRS